MYPFPRARLTVRAQILINRHAFEWAKGSCANREKVDVANGSCKLKSLNIDVFASELVIEQCATLLQLTTCKLRFLVVRVGRVDSPATSMLRDALLAHTHQQQLEYVRLVYNAYVDPNNPRPTGTRLRELFVDVVSADSRYVRPLPLRTKLALLSVLNHEAMDATAASRLDASVLAIIFGFASMSHTRVVEIGPHWNYQILDIVHDPSATMWS